MSDPEEVLSSFLAIKGPFVESTYRTFSDWDFDRSKRANLREVEETNSIGASSNGWLRQFTKVTNRRYEPNGADRPLVELVQNGWHIEDWRPVQLWHLCRTDELLRTFISEWLFNLREEGIVVITTDSVEEFLRSITKKRLGSDSVWKETTYRRVSSGLLKTVTEFGLMRGRVSREFESYRIPERSFLYLLHAMMEREQSTRNVVDAADWRLFLMRPNEVEEELLRLHQYGKLHFERAGSFLELTLPCENTAEYVRSLAG